LKSTIPIGFSNFKSHTSNATQQPRHYLVYPHRLKEKHTSIVRFENSDAEYKQQQQPLTNPITWLQQEYSKYVFHNAIFKGGKDQSVLLASNSSNQLKPILSSIKHNTKMTPPIEQIGKRPSSHANETRSEISSINLPIVSQLQVMLANQYVDNSGGQTKSVVSLAGRQILSSPVPLAPVIQKSANFYRGTDSKQASITTSNEAKAKILDERSSSAFTINESRRSGFTQDSRSTTRAGQEQDASKGISLRQLRKMMEQIFQEELKRYGL
jgi:hypothetical protein